MPSFDEVSALRAKRRMRIYGHLATAFIAVLATLALLTACASVEKSIEYQNRAELVRCQNQDAGWADACRRVQQQNDAAGERTLSEHIPQNNLNGQIGQNPLAASNY